MRSEDAPPKSASVPSCHLSPKGGTPEELAEQKKLRKSTPKRQESAASRTRLLESPASQPRAQVGLTGVSAEKAARKGQSSQFKRPEQYATEPKVGCNCRRTACLKMYCACFSKGELCNKNCSCEECENLKDNMHRSEAINQVITKDPQAFSKGVPPVQLISNQDGCRCRNSSCIMKYCKCFAQHKVCTERCVCEGCKNTQQKSRRGESREHHDPSLEARKLPKKKPKPEWKP